MTAPYPSPETAAHMLAEEIMARTPEETRSTTEALPHEHFVEGLRHAAWLLNIEKLVEAKLRGEGT